MTDYQSTVTKKALMGISANSLRQQIKQVTGDLEEELIELRRHFHKFPELSWEESETGEKIAAILRAQGLRVDSGVCGTGVIANYVGSTPGPTIALRADMDALPIYDAKDVTYASQRSGAMHACGHDAHIAMSIGVAKVLSSMKVELPGRVRFLFQPSEEATPSGAKEMTKLGAMAEVDRVLAYHVDPEIEVGKIGLREGILTAHCNEFRLAILGKSGHAARPHQAIDPIFLATRVLSQLYDIIGSRSQNAIPAVLSVGKVEGGTKANIIPERVDVSGSIRTIDESTRHEIMKAVEHRAATTTELAGGSYKLEFLEPVPSVFNDPGLVGIARHVASNYLASENIVNIEKISMGGEDFSWFSSQAPGLLMRLGVKDPAGPVRYLHTHDFDIAESALATGVGLMACIITTLLLDGVA